MPPDDFQLVSGVRSEGACAWEGGDSGQGRHDPQLLQLHWAVTGQTRKAQRLLHTRSLISGCTLWRLQLRKHLDVIQLLVYDNTDTC